MERSMRIVLLTALLTVSVFAQNRSAAPARGHSGPPPAMRPVGPPPVGRPPIARPPIGARPFYPRTGAVPYPVFIGGGYYEPPVSGSDYGYAPPAPAAVVNQDFQTDSGTPSLIDYSNVSLPEAAPDADATSQLKDDQPTIFLIALTDHSVVAAIAYWVDGDTLHWVSRDAKENRMSLSLVDRDFSKQLNDERHVDFKLPPAK
jgi:hypothetical protein